MVWCRIVAHYEEAIAKLAQELGVDPGEIRLAAPHDSKVGG